jgi:endonuclease/exonuclease/phosphatase family metal-dependent hydrolase
MSSRHRRRRRGRLVLFGLLALALWWWWSRESVTLGTFNIRQFPEATTDHAAVARAIGELDVDAFAVQEIAGRDAFDAALRAAGERDGRSLRASLSPYCKEGTPFPLHLGVVYDAARVELLRTRALGPSGACEGDQPHGVAALLRARDGTSFALAAIHMKAGGGAAEQEIRRRQWAWLLAALPELEEDLGAPVIVAGDFNSTGYLEREHPERRFIAEQLARAGRELATGSLGCSMYWQPDRERRRWAPSLLDHVLAPPGLTSEPEALGMCARLACEPQDEVPPEWRTLSDHCPVRVRLR